MKFKDINGKEVRTPKEFNWRPATYGVLIENKNLLVIKPKWDSEKFSLPGGGLKLGEDIVEGIKREFLEETGYEVLVNERPMHVETKLYADHKEKHFFQRINTYFEVRRKNKKQKNKLDAETTLLKWVDLKTIKPKDFTFFQQDIIKKILNTEKPKNI